MSFTITIIKKRGYNMYHISDSDKHYLGSLVVLVGVVFFWRGVWDTIYLVPILENPFVSFFIGLSIITFTGVIFKEFDPFAAKIQKTRDILNEITSHKHDKNKGFSFKYYDEIAKKHHSIPHHQIRKMENNFVIIEQKGKELFIPIHRIHEIHHKDTIIWKK